MDSGRTAGLEQVKGRSRLGKRLPASQGNAAAGSIVESLVLKHDFQDIGRFHDVSGKLESPLRAGFLAFAAARAFFPGYLVRAVFHAMRPCRAKAGAKAAMVAQGGIPEDLAGMALAFGI